MQKPEYIKGSDQDSSSNKSENGHYRLIVSCQSRIGTSVCYFWIFIMIAVFTGLGGCAGFNPSILDTAQTLGKHQFEISYASSPGLDVPEWSRMDSEYMDEDTTSGAMQFWELRYGLEEDIDGSIRFSPSPNGISSKVMIKKQLSKQDKISTAVAFGGGLIIGNQNYWNDGFDVVEDVKHRLYSTELQLLATRGLIRDIFVTLAGKANAHWYYSKKPGLETNVKEFHHAGMRLIVSRSFKGFTLLFEGGVEAPLSGGEIRKAYPWGGMKMSVKLNKKNK